MTVSDGWMMPEMNCALKLASKSPSFSSSNFSEASFSRPKTFTMLRPVCISSMWPLSVPVRSHCAANCFCERFAMAMVTTTESGTVSSEIVASSQLIQNIMREHADDGEERRDDLREALLQRVGDVVDVVGHAREDVAARVAVEVAQRQARELLVDLVAQPVDDALRHAHGEVLLEPLEDGAQQVDEGEQQQHPAR